MAERTLTAIIPAAAAGADTETILGTVTDRAYAIAAVRYHPVSVVTGVSTNTRKIEVWNRGAGGAGTSVLASKQFDSGVNAPALADTPITVTSAGSAGGQGGTAANPGAVAVQPGDTLTVRSIHVGTGLADPGGTVEVDLAAAVPPF